MIGRSDDLVPTAEELDRMRSRLDAAIGEEQSGLTRAVPRSQKRSFFGSGLVAALASVAVIVPAAIFWGSSPGNHPSEVPVGAETPVEPTTTIATVVQNADWASTELPNFVGDLTVHHGRFYAISAEEVLVSDNGVEWTVAGRLPDDSDVGLLVPHGDVLVANGSEMTQDAEGGRVSTPKIWVSADDGKTWSVAMVGEYVASVVSTPIGLVAPGFIDLDPVSDQQPRKAAVWISDDGFNWALAWEAEGNSTLSSTADAVIWEDGLVIVGAEGPAYYSEGSGKSDPGWDRVVWTGRSASELSASALTNLLGNLEDLTSPSFGHFALTYGFDSSNKDSSAVWRSDDGINWTNIDLGVGWYHNSITADGSTTVIAGETLGPAPGPEVRIWYTLDGETWAEYDTSAIPKGLRVKSVELHNGALVAALYSNDEVGGYLFSTPFEP